MVAAVVFWKAQCRLMDLLLFFSFFFRCPNQRGPVCFIYYEGLREEKGREESGGKGVCFAFLLSFSFGGFIAE